MVTSPLQDLAAAVAAVETSAKESRTFAGGDSAIVALADAILAYATATTTP